MTTQFSFVNISQAASLDTTAVKAVRAHVTKGNFARRRRRLEQAYKQQKATARKSPSQPVNVLDLSHSTPKELDLQTNTSPLSHPGLADELTICFQFLLHEFQPLIFPCAGGLAGPAREAGWAILLTSEPALVEASMAVGLKHHPVARHTSFARRSHYHAYRAVRMINQRINAVNQILSDGLLAAVFVLSFDKFLGMLVSARRDLSGLRDSFDTTTNSPSFLEENTVAAEIDQRINILHPMAQLLNLEKRPSVKCLGSALLTFLSLDWPRDLLAPFSADASFPLGFLAERLQLNLMAANNRVPSTISLTIGQLFVGAAAADAGSKTRIWFQTELQTVLTNLRLTEWEDICLAISMSFVPAARLLQRFRNVWDEIRLITPGIAAPTQMNN
ncbi:hypothetical protein HJFPF1_13216 [Paramyrothecium foliicola]|nr:hypothetical protein HJFPF1_13216 [Paramyrothecium foliicola]